MSDQISVTRRGGDSATQMRTLIDYKDESWIGKPRFLLDGVIYRYTDADEEYIKPKQVPSDKIVAYLEGNWRKQIKYRFKGEKVSFE